MAEKFKKEIDIVMSAVKRGITANIELSDKQKKYIKNLLLFALMNASTNETVTNKNFIKLVNKLFKSFLIKIIKEDLDDDDDFDDALNVDLNQLTASDALLKNTDLQQIFTPEKIFNFLKVNTSGVSRKDLVKKLMALRDVKANYRETPREQKKREKRQKDFEMQKQREHMMERALERERGARGRS